MSIRVHFRYIRLASTMYSPGNMSQELSVQKTEILWKSMKYLALPNIMEYQSILLHVVAFCVTRCTRISKRDWTAADFGSSFSCITCDRFPMVHQAARGGMWLKRREREGTIIQQTRWKSCFDCVLNVFPKEMLENMDEYGIAHASIGFSSHPSRQLTFLLAEWSVLWPPASAWLAHFATAVAKATTAVPRLPIIQTSEDSSASSQRS